MRVEYFFRHCRVARGVTGGAYREWNGHWGMTSGENPAKKRTLLIGWWPLFDTQVYITRCQRI
ncbi:MAG: hypothetical protein HXS44_12055 [Theionarchaea archaeon]|nr:hypothetical protein [Theionarchaea archaeon]